MSHSFRRALDSGRLVIRPEPGPRYPDPTDQRQYCPYDTHSVDRHSLLGDEIVIPEPGTYTFDLSQPEPLSPFLTRNSRRVPDPPRDRLPPQASSVHPGSDTRVRQSADRSSRKCRDLSGPCANRGKKQSGPGRTPIHFTAPTVHPGFSGTLTLEMINLGPTSILLRPGNVDCPVDHRRGERHSPTQPEPVSGSDQSRGMPAATLSARQLDVRKFFFRHCDATGLRGGRASRVRVRFPGRAPCDIIGPWPDRCGSNIPARSIT